MTNGTIAVVDTIVPHDQLAVQHGAVHDTDDVDTLSAHRHRRHDLVRAAELAGLAADSVGLEDADHPVDEHLGLETVRKAGSPRHVRSVEEDGDGHTDDHERRAEPERSERRAGRVDVANTFGEKVDGKCHAHEERAPEHAAVSQISNLVEVHLVSFQCDPKDFGRRP